MPTPKLTNVISIESLAPGMPNDGDRHLVSANPDPPPNAFDGHANEVATWDDASSSWTFAAPGDQDITVVDAEDVPYTYDSITTDWVMGTTRLLRLVYDVAVSEGAVIKETITIDAVSGLIDMQSGGSLAIDGPFQCAARQVFSGDALDQVTLRPESTPQLDAAWWGFVPSAQATENASRLQACVSGLRSRSILSINPGDYSVSSATLAELGLSDGIAIPNDRIAIVGAGARATKLTMTDSYKVNFLFANNKSELALRGIHFVGNGQVNNSRCGALLVRLDQSADVADFDVEDCLFEGFGGPGWVWFHANKDGYAIKRARVRRNVFFGGDDFNPVNRETSAAQIYFSGISEPTNEIASSFCEISENHCDASQVKTGIACLYDFQDSLLFGNTVLNCGLGHLGPGNDWGIEVKEDNGSPAFDATHTIESTDPPPPDHTGSPVSVNGSAASRVIRYQLTSAENFTADEAIQQVQNGSTATGTITAEGPFQVKHAYGINLYNRTRRLIVSSNIVRDPYSSGIYVPTCEDVIVVDNIVTGQRDSYDPQISRGGIAIHAAARFVVSGNITYDCFFGIQIQPTDGGVCRGNCATPRDEANAIAIKLRHAGKDLALVGNQALYEGSNDVDGLVFTRPSTDVDHCYAYAIAANVMDGFKYAIRFQVVSSAQRYHACLLSSNLVHGGSNADYAIIARSALEDCAVCDNLAAGNFALAGIQVQKATGLNMQGNLVMDVTTSGKPAFDLGGAEGSLWGNQTRNCAEVLEDHPPTSPLDGTDLGLAADKPGTGGWFTTAEDGIFVQIMAPTTSTIIGWVRRNGSWDDWGAIS